MPKIASKNLRQGKIKMNILSNLNRCLNLSANIDQTGRALIQDIVISMMDEGVVAVVPIETDRDPIENESFKIYSLRTAKIIQWYPRAVQVKEPAVFL